MNIFWLLNMRRWLRNPPSLSRVKWVLAVVVLCLALGIYEYMFGWPDALTVNNTGHRRIIR